MDPVLLKHRKKIKGVKIDRYFFPPLLLCVEPVVKTHTQL